MKEKKELPGWSIAAAITAALVIVAAIFVKGAVNSGDVSRDELIKMRQAQDHRPIDAPAPSPGR